MDKINIQLSDLSDKQREIAEIIGLDKYIELSRHFGGEDSVYIQKYSELVKISRKKEILDKFNGYNVAELARMYNLSERYVRLICYGNDIEGQMKF